MIKHFSMVKDSRLVAFACAALLFYPTFAARTAEKKMSVEKRAPQHGYDYEHPAPQTLTENLDLVMYARIREEGFSHSHIMEYASALFDGIGPRLTGSPNLAKANAWTRDQLTAIGWANAQAVGRSLQVPRLARDLHY